MESQHSETSNNQSIQHAHLFLEPTRSSKKEGKRLSSSVPSMFMIPASCLTGSICTHNLAGVDVERNGSDHLTFEKEEHGFELLDPEVDLHAPLDHWTLGPCTSSDLTAPNPVSNGLHDMAVL